MSLFILTYLLSVLIYIRTNTYKSCTIKRTKKDPVLAIEDYHFNHIVEPHLWDKITETFGGKDASTKAFAEKNRWKTWMEKRFCFACN